MDSDRPEQPWEVAERAFTLWQYARGNPDRAVDAVAALVRVIPGMPAHLPQAIHAHLATLPPAHPDRKPLTRLRDALTTGPAKTLRSKKWDRYTIECNTCGLRQEVEVFGNDPDETRIDALAALTREGWRETPNRRHYCPACAPHAKRTKP